MQYELVKPAITRILSEAKTDGTGIGWSTDTTATTISRTTTAQVLITLSKCTEFLNSQDEKELLAIEIEKGFNYLEKSIQTGNSELPTFAFTLIAHLEHNQRFPILHPLNKGLVITCLTEIKSADFYLPTLKAYQYSNSCERKYFPTYLALQAYLKLLDIWEWDKEPKLDGFTKDTFLEEIDNCFKYLLLKLNTKVAAIATLDFRQNAEFLPIGIQVSHYYDVYTKVYKRIPNLTNSKENLEKSIAYFTENLESSVFIDWAIKIHRCEFKLVYISNLISGLLKYRTQLTEVGLKLLYDLLLFICTDTRMQELDATGNIICTKYIKTPVWATAHSLNAILKMECSINEIKWINKGNVTPVETLPTLSSQDVEPNTQAKINFDFSDFGKKASTLIILPIFTGLISSIIFTNYLINKVEVKNYFLVGILLAAISAAIYFLPKIIFKQLGKLLNWSAENEKKIAVFGYFLMIIAYLIIIYHYTIQNKT